MAFTVQGLPNNSLSFTNKVYLSPASWKSLSQPQFLLINGSAVFAVAAHEGVDNSSLAVSSLAREVIDCSIGQQVSVSATSTEDENIAASVEFELELMSKVKSVIREEEVEETVRKLLEGHVLHSHQKCAIDLKGKVCTVVVQKIEALNPTSEKEFKRPVHRARVDSSTAVFVTARSTALLEFKAFGGGSKLRALQGSWDWESIGVGGLGAEFGTIMRRAFLSRQLPARAIAKLGMKHTRGMVLYGPPGTGKTLIARKIGELLGGREPKVVNGPEVLNKYVGQSEANVRDLFKDAEEDQKQHGDESDLHIIIFDEADALFRTRGTVGGGTGVHDSIVNTVLATLDGVKQLNNILVIAMTNRLDLLDTALLRPGRLEVQVEIGLPDAAGRHSIFRIHTKIMRENNLLRITEEDEEKIVSLTKNYSGAEIEGLVRSAQSFAVYDKLDPTTGFGKQGKFDDVIVTMDHFMRALEEVRPAFGVADADLQQSLRRGFLQLGPRFQSVLDRATTTIDSIKTSHGSTVRLLLHGVQGCGKSAVAATLALHSQIAFVRRVAADQFVDSLGDAIKIGRLRQAFDDAYKSKLSLLIIDDIEDLIGYSPVGPRFSNEVVQALITLLRKPPPHEDRRLVVIATTSMPRILKDLRLAPAFHHSLRIPPVTEPAEVKVLIDHVPELRIKDSDMTNVCGAVAHRQLSLSRAQTLFDIVASRTRGAGPVDHKTFMEVAADLLETADTGASPDFDD